MKLKNIYDNRQKGTKRTYSKKQLLDARIKKSMHKLENTAEISKTKRLIAQAKTVIKEKEIEVTNA